MTEETVQKLTVEVLAQLDKRGDRCSVSEAREIAIALLACLPEQKPVATIARDGSMYHTQWHSVMPELFKLDVYGDPLIKPMPNGIIPVTTGVVVKTVDSTILSQNFNRTTYLGRIDRPEGGDAWIELTRNESLSWPDTVRAVDDNQ